MELKHLGEVKTIQMIKKFAGKKNRFLEVGIGDDACVLKGGQILTTDSFLEGVHFDFSYFDHQSLGARVASATLADIAAMAGKPTLLLVSLYLPKETKKEELLFFYKGIKSICRKYNCAVAGGDIVASEKLGITLTALGQTDRPIKRSSAQVGDKVFVTGFLGLSETGRMAIRNGLPLRDYREATAKHLRPKPRIEEAWRLRKSINSLIDTSDGLSTDINHIARESKVKIKIFWEKIPIHKETRSLCEKMGIGLKNFVLSAGEDFELLFTTNKKPPKIKGIKITEIGKCEKGEGVFLIEGDKEEILLPSGYDHLTSGG